MPLLVTGSIGIDTVKTTFGVSENCLGGSAVYFSYAASFFSPVRFVGVIGPDCPFELAKIFEGKDVDLAGLEVRENSKTFRWSGTYHDDMDNRTTDYLELNVLAEAPPKVPEQFSDSNFIFLANTAPKLQLELLEQIKEPVFVAADTMNCWIENNLAHLKLLLKRINCLILNEDEARLLACEKNLIKAGKSIIGMGPKYVLIKKGQAGSLLYSADGEMFILPAYPVENVMDPTGAGDSFAGGFMGYLAQKRTTDSKSLKEAIAYGTVTASFTIEGFSLNGLSSITKNDIDSRFDELKKMTSF
ncbi:MAG: bifunctional hydroxymethylpyrimidine kinase/phosphomethylpyrimidine kinase [Sedimentisphaerales bacterium]|nr:bifunctional hydroxymethylpyrimidine kinase/phosphomethylpyrimidine kinase [Sedimentisphaerales bacterium]